MPINLGLIQKENEEKEKQELELQQNKKLNSYIDVGGLKLAKSRYEYKAEYKNQIVNKQNAKKDLQDYYSSNGITSSYNGIFPTVNPTTYQNTLEQFDKYKYTNVPLNPSQTLIDRQKASKENYEKYLAFQKENETTIQEKKKEVVNQYNKTAEKYNDYQQRKLDSDNIGLYDKTLGSVIGGITSPFSQFGGEIAINENGGVYYTPSYNDLKHQKVIDSYSDSFLGTLGKIGSSALYESGKIATTVALNTLVKGLGSTVYFTDLYTKQYNQTLSEGYTSSQALTYATLGTLLEAATGKALGGTTKAVFGGSSSEMSQLIGSGLSKLIKNHPHIVNGVANAISEGSEEFIQEYLDEFNRNISLGEDNKITSETFENAIYSAAVGALTGGVTGAFDGNTYQKLRKQNINVNADTNINENVSNKTEGSQLENNKNNVINQNSQVNQNNPLSININNNIQEQTELNNSLNSNVTTPFTYNQTNNTKVNNMYQSMVDSQMNNTEDTIKLAEVVSKIIEDKDYNIVFDENITNEKGQSVNALVTTNDNNEVEIRINPNSDRAGEFLLTHEISHAIKSDEMIKLVNDFASRNEGFAQALKEIEARYGKNLTSEEVFADVCGQLFGNQEFINSLETQNTVESRTLIKQIYELIKKLLNRFTQEGRYRNFVSNLEGMWRQAYANTTMEQSVDNLNNETIFSIQTDNKGKKYVNVDTNQDIFKGKNLIEQIKIAKQYILDNFRQNGININNENINVTSKTAKEYTHPKNQLPIVTKSSKMKASTELDNLLSVSEYKYSRSDDGRHSFAKDGWDYYETTFKVGDNLFTGLVNIGKSGNKKTLYDITNIKRIDQNRSTSANAFSTSLVNSVENNIPQNDANVKSGSSTKYSIPINENNTQELNSDYFSYRGSHQIQEAKSIIELNINDLENKVIDINGGLTRQDQSDLRKLKKILNNPTEKVTIYRASPVNELNNGDWVTTDREYAKNISFNNGGKVYKYEVNSSELYYPDDVKELPSLHRLSSFKYIEDNTKYSQELDNEGRELSKEQQEFFKDSKVRDENGNLKVLYHGTPFGDFNVFKGEMFFFSEDYRFAEDYADSKSFEQGLDGDRRVIEAYINAKNVFDVTNPKDIQKLRETLSDEINYWGKIWKKETLLDRLQRRKVLEPKWKSEQVKGKKFGDYIGNDRNGYNTDMFVGINKNNEIVYISQERGLQQLTEIEKKELEKKLMSGEEATYFTYKTMNGELTEQQILKKINEAKQYGEDIISRRKIRK